MSDNRVLKKVQGLPEGLVNRVIMLISMMHSHAAQIAAVDKICTAIEVDGEVAATKLVEEMSEQARKHLHQARAEHQLKGHALRERHRHAGRRH